MGYDYGFHLAIVKPPKEVALAAVAFVEGDQKGECPIETFAKEVVNFCKEFHNNQNYNTQGFWFPGLGEKFHSGSGSYSCGNVANGLEKSMAIIGNRFPEAVFALHHYYWDMTKLTVYTFQGDKILDKTSVDFENYRVGPYTICLQIDFLRVAINGNTSMFFNEEYYYDEFDFKYEAIYECAGIPLPVRTII